MPLQPTCCFSACGT